MTAIEGLPAINAKVVSALERAAEQAHRKRDISDDVEVARAAQELLATINGAVSAVQEQRDIVVRALIANGRSHSWIAEATGLTRGRIAQISQGIR